jgi:hypothetical protein
MVSDAYTIVDPGTVVIESLNTNITNGTMA